MDVTWEWESSTDQSNWTPVTGADTNSITLGTEDIGNYYRVTATYDDEKGSGKTATGETTNAVVTAPPTNQNPEFDSNAATTVTVVENTPAGENIGDAYTATHADSVGTLVYSLDTTGANTFDIDTSTGQLKTKVALDHESTPSYTVTVSVTDGMDDYSNADTAEDDSIDVTISVTNIEVPAMSRLRQRLQRPTGCGEAQRHLDGGNGHHNSAVDGYDVQYQEKDAQSCRYLDRNVCHHEQRHNHHRAGLQQDLRGAGAVKEQRGGERLVDHWRGKHPKPAECVVLAGIPDG